MYSFFLFLLLLGGLILLTRPLTTLLHELGHAIPALLITRNKVTVYIGTYGDPAKSIRIRMGRLEAYFRYNPFLWWGGVCIIAEEELSFNRNILVTLAGPLASFTIAVINCYYTFLYDLHGLLKLFLIVFLGSSLFDLCWNLVPSKTPITLFDGRVTYNDGYQLKQLLKYRRLTKKYQAAFDLFKEERYVEAVPHFDKILQQGVDQEDMYRYAFHNYLLAEDYEKAKILSDKFYASATMNIEDLYNRGWLFLKLGLLNEALEIYTELLQQQPEYAIALNNLGYTLSLLNRFDEAVPPLDMSIELDNSQAYAYNNRGLARIKTGETEAGLQDIYHSMELDPNNAYTHKNLGIYHFDRGEYAEALQLFTKAKEMDKQTYRIDAHIHETQQLLNGH